MTSLASKTALVMGASSRRGIGAGIAAALSAAGANVAISARSEDKLAVTADDLGLAYRAADVTDEDSLERLASWVVDEFGSLDIAVFATGLNHFSLISALDIDTARPTIETQLIGGLLFIKHCAAAMKSGGSIIMLSSLTANLPAHGTSVYAGTKAAVEQITKVAAIEYADQDIRVNGIAPGMVRTDMTEMMFTNPHMHLEKAVVKETPLGRLGGPEDIAAAAVWLAGDECFMTGHTLPMAGGAELRRIPTLEEMTG